MKQVGKDLLHHPAAGQHVGNAAGYAQIVFQHHEIPVRIANQIGAENRDIDVARDFHVPHLAAEMFAGVDNAARHNSIFNNLAFVVDVFQEKIQRRDPLGQSTLNFFPFGAR